MAVMKPIGIYAAFLSSARLASWRRISVVPVNRSSGVSQSWKNTTFIAAPARRNLPICLAGDIAACPLFN